MPTSGDEHSANPERESHDGSTTEGRPESVAAASEKPTPSPAANWRPKSRRGDSGADTEGIAPQPVVTSPPTPLTQQIGRIVVIMLAVAFGIFAVANSQFVDFSWIFGETAVVSDASGARVGGGVPLILLLTSSAVIGALVGSLVTWQTGRVRRRRHLSDDG